MEDQFPALEQYKLYVEMADRVSARRAETNKFYISLISALLAFLIFVVSREIIKEYIDIIIIAFSLLGLILNASWFVNIRSYRQLNSGKFKVIHEMENQLPFPCYTKEWEILGHGKDSKQYRKLTKVELFIPFILAIPYVVLLIYYIFK